MVLSEIVAMGAIRLLQSSLVRSRRLVIDALIMIALGFPVLYLAQLPAARQTRRSRAPRPVRR
jgi:hypothetical protein